MNTQTNPQISRSSNGQQDHPAAADEWKGHEITTFPGHRLVKWFGALSTALIGMAALTPSTFSIPANLQPWVFLTSIIWFFAFCAGMFGR